MALFKIFRGQSSNLQNQYAVEVYCYFTPDDGKFYIDTAGTLGDNTTAVIGTNRIALNARLADYAARATYDINGNALNPITAKGDLIYGTLDTNNKAKYTRLGIGTSGQVLKVGNDGIPEWGEIVALPKGGTAGQYLVKSSAINGDATWSTLTATTLLGSSTVGSASKPVYWNGSKLVAISSYEGKASTAGTADQTSKSIAIKFDSGSTEGTDLFTFNGSATKTINIVGSTNVTIDDSTAGTLSFSSPSLSGGTAVSSKQIISGVTVSGHAVTATAKTLSNGNGISISDSGSAITIGHSNSITAQTTQGLYPIKIDAQGHITAYGSAVTALKNPNALTIGSIIYDGSAAKTVTAATLGLSNALHFIGIATNGIVDGGTADPGISGYTTKVAGDVVIDKDSSYEFVWTGSKWERLGPDGSYKITQTAVSSPSASGSTTAFIDAISQDTNGNITVTKKNLDTSGTWSGNAASATEFASAKSVALTGDVTGSTSSKGGWSIATTLANSGVTAASYGPSANASPAHGASFSVPYITVDAKGRITSASTKTITLPSDNNTWRGIADTSTAIQASDSVTQGTSTSSARADHTHNLPTSGVTAGSYGPTANVNGSNGTTINVPQITVDKYGRVTSVTNRTYTSVNTDTNTNTTNTAGATDTSSKIYLIGATSQAASPQTYSDNQVYATNGQLDANVMRIAEAVSLVYDSTNKCLNFVFA